MHNDFTFVFEGKEYGYELDGYKPLGVYDTETGDDVDDPAVYEAACLHAAERLQARREYQENWAKENLQ